MQQTLQQESYDQLLHLSESMIQSLNDLNVDELQNKVREYLRKIQNRVYALNSSKVTAQNLNELKQMILLHENITLLFNKERENLSKKLMKLHAGKKMQNTYPGK